MLPSGSIFHGLAQFCRTYLTVLRLLCLLSLLTGHVFSILVTHLTTDTLHSAGLQICYAYIIDAGSFFKKSKSKLLKSLITVMSRKLIHLLLSYSKIRINFVMFHYACASYVGMTHHQNITMCTLT